LFRRTAGAFPFFYGLSKKTRVIVGLFLEKIRAPMGALSGPPGDQVARGPRGSVGRGGVRPAGWWDSENRVAIIFLASPLKRKKQEPKPPKEKARMGTEMPDGPEWAITRLLNNRVVTPWFRNTNFPIKTYDGFGTKHLYMHDMLLTNGDVVKHAVFALILAALFGFLVYQIYSYVETQKEYDEEQKEKLEKAQSAVPTRAVG
jgi:hypothetical protein